MRSNRKSTSDGEGGFYRWTRPKARSNYTCQDCGKRIEIGVVHSNLSGISGVFDFNYISFRYCNKCEFEDNNINPENLDIIRLAPNEIHHASST